MNDIDLLFMKAHKLFKNGIFNFPTLLNTLNISITYSSGNFLIGFTTGISQPTQKQESFIKVSFADPESIETAFGEDYNFVVQIGVWTDDYTEISPSDYNNYPYWFDMSVFDRNSWYINLNETIGRDLKQNEQNHLELTFRIMKNDGTIYNINSSVSYFPYKTSLDNSYHPNELDKISEILNRRL